MKIHHALMMFALCLLVACDGSKSHTGDNQSAIPNPGNQELSQLLEHGERRLQEIEGMTKQMATKDEITLYDNTLTMAALDDYSLTMETAYAATRRDTRLAGETQGTSGDAQSAPLFESAAQDHEQRLDQLRQAMQSFAARVQRGEVRFQREVLAQMKPDQRDDLHSWLAPQAAASMQKQHPDLFPQKTLSKRLRRAAKMANNLVGTICKALPTSTERVLIGRAEAKVVFGCIGPCVARNWGQCSSCVGSTVPQVSQAIESFQDCWRRAGWWLPRIGCVFSLIGVLA